MKRVPLTRGKYAIVDNEDFERVSKLKWHFLNTGGGYAKHTYYLGDYKQKDITLHRFIINAPEGVEVDHINGNGLDNRKCNLRLCNRTENTWHTSIRSHNTHGFKGVSYNNTGKRIRRYKGRIRVNNKVYHLGYFLTAEEAAHAYDEAAKKYHGEFALLNFK